MGARRAHRRVAVDERSIVSTLRGFPGWTCTLLAIAISMTGVALDSSDGELGSIFTVAFFLGCVLSVLVVARRSLFVAGVQPPIIMTALVPLVYMIAGTGGKTGFFSRTQIISAILPLVSRFPLMLVTTVVVLALALIRAYVVQPRNRVNHPPRVSPPRGRPSAGSEARAAARR